MRQNVGSPPRAATITLTAGLYGLGLLILGCAPHVAIDASTEALKRLEKQESQPTMLAPLTSEEDEGLSSPKIEREQSTHVAKGDAEAAPDDEKRNASETPETKQNAAPESGLSSPANDPSQLRSVVAVCPTAYRDALAPWVVRRQREGLEVCIIESAATAEDLKASLRKNAPERCQYILLVGDSSYTPRGESVDSSSCVPTLYRAADVTAPYQQTPQLPGDFGFGDFDDDGLAEAAVGRLPVKSSEQLTAVINRIIAYEDSTNFGAWRSRVDLVAGIGGFGPMIDGAIEMVAGGIITGSLPGFVRTRITHASPTSDFHPGADRFTTTVLNNFRDGARFWVYAGHGWVNELDRVPPTQFGRPVLSTSDLPELQCDHGTSPIALMLACYTGAFDGNEDCLAEQMLLADQGPIAVLAGSRVTMPYGNASAAVGLIHAVYQRKADRLGDAWRDALREMATSTQNDPELRSRRMMIDGIASIMGGGSRIDDERREHMQLYNWFGDPTLRLGSDAEVTLESAMDAYAGKPLDIKGQSPVAGKLTVEVHRRLGSSIPAKNGLEAGGGSKYMIANETMLCRMEHDIQAGQWTSTLEIPASSVANASSTTPIIIRATVVGESAYATGSQTGWLRPAPELRAKTNMSSTDSATTAETR